MKHLAGLLFLALQLGCLGHTLAGLGPGTPTVERASVRPAEQDAKLTCAGSPCDAAPVERSVRPGRSRPVFWSVFLVEVAGAAFAGLQYAKGSSPFWAPVGASLLGLGMIDLVTFTGASDYGRQEEPLRLSQGVTADWRGARVELRTSDVVPPGSAQAPARFSVSTAANRAPTPAAPAPAARAGPARGRVAVLDLRSSAADLGANEVRYFGDLVRAATLKAAPQLEVMTRENLLVLMQAAGRDLAQCEGECEVDTGRRIGADYIVSGEVLKVGTRLKLSLRLHETKEGKLVGATVASGATIDQLDESATQAVIDLFKRSAP